MRETAHYFLHSSIKGSLYKRDLPSQKPFSTNTVLFGITFGPSQNETTYPEDIPFGYLNWFP